MVALDLTVYQGLLTLFLCRGLLGESGETYWAILIKVYLNSSSIAKYIEVNKTFEVQRPYITFFA